MPIASEHYGSTPDEQTVTLFTLARGNLVAALTDFGAHLVSLHAPDRAGRRADITLGYDTLNGWLNDAAYMGATVGRVGNRIAGGRFTLEGHDYQLACNEDGVNHLHGGGAGFNVRLWRAEPFDDDRAVGVKFTRTSPDGEEGYPGTLDATAVYALTDDDALIVDFAATADRPTIVNMVHHTYWHLGGHDAGDVLDHELRIDADCYLPVDEHSIPAGGRADVTGTPMDFRDAKPIGRDIGQLTNDPRGYDHNWCLNGYDPRSPRVRRAIELHDPASGRTMMLGTDQPGVQFYTGNHLEGTVAGKSAVRYGQYAGLCLETQHYPDTPNHAEFPSIVLRPGGTYTHRMVHTFGVR